MTDDCVLRTRLEAAHAGAFEFVLDSELKRAVRYQNYLTLVTVETSREWEGMTVTADDGTLQEVAQVIRREMRDTDLLGHTDKGTLGLVLLDADFEHSTRVIDRLVSRIENYKFPTALRIAVGAACYPTHAIDAESLKRQALSRPIVNWRGGSLAVARSELRSHCHETHCPSSARDRRSRRDRRVRATGAPRPAALPGQDANRTRSRRRRRRRLPTNTGSSSGDKLRIEVYKDAQLSQSVQVRPDGKITLPLIGDIEANGRTPIELRDAIRDALKEYITNPTVTVIVVEAMAATAYVMGEVNHPGAVTLQAPLTVLQALALAGGLKDFADAKNIRILRKGRVGVQTITFNYKDAIAVAARAGLPAARRHRRRARLRRTARHDTPVTAARDRLSPRSLRPGAAAAQESNFVAAGRADRQAPRRLERHAGGRRRQRLGRQRPRPRRGRRDARPTS